jgi:hypothetical protein
MTKNQVKEILDRVLTWPPERRADVVHMVELKVAFEPAARNELDRIFA